MGIPLEFSVLGYCADWLRRGNYISPAPPFLTLCRAFETRGLRCSYRGGPFGALLVRRRRPTLHRPPLAGYGRGPSLRCVRLRRFCSWPPASALPNHAVLSHPLRGAYRAFESGDNVWGRESAAWRLPRYCAGRLCSGPGVGIGASLCILLEISLSTEY